MNVKLADKHKIMVTSSADIFKIMQQFLLRDNMVDREKEHLWTISLSQSNIIMDIELISLGSYAATVVEPMNVFRVAVMKDAVRIILCHNHPGERLVASEADKDITDRLIQVGRILNIEVIDHLIITTKDYMSFAYDGLMEELMKSEKWVPNFELASKIRREEAKIQRMAVKEAKAKALLNVAKTMLKDNESLEKIIRYSGLTKEEIEKIKI